MCARRVCASRGRVSRRSSLETDGAPESEERSRHGQSADVDATYISRAAGRHKRQLVARNPAVSYIGLQPEAGLLLEPIEAGGHEKGVAGADVRREHPGALLERHSGCGRLVEGRALPREASRDPPHPLPPLPQMPPPFYPTV